MAAAVRTGEDTRESVYLYCSLQAQVRTALFVSWHSLAHINALHPQIGSGLAASARHRMVSNSSILLTLDVVAKDLAVALSPSLSKSLSSLAAARHGCSVAAVSESGVVDKGSQQIVSTLMRGQLLPPAPVYMLMSRTQRLLLSQSKGSDSDEGLQSRARPPAKLCHSLLLIAIGKSLPDVASYPTTHQCSVDL